MLTNIITTLISIIHELYPNKKYCSGSQTLNKTKWTELHINNNLKIEREK